MVLRRKSVLLAALAASVVTESSAFQHAAHNHRGISQHGLQKRQCIEMTAIAEVATQQDRRSPSGACYYRRADGPWRPRKELSRLSIGERLFATRLPESDLLEGKSGPKAFLECGIGRRDKKGRWSIVNGMVRIGRKGMKKSVVRKKIKRMPPNELIEVYVSKVSLAEGTLEVCLNRDEALQKGSVERKIPASSLKEGEELAGTVKQVTPYGVFVDVNANRNGLLHISKVAKQRDAYINKEDGLKKIGLGRGSSVNVIVLRNQKKRLELDLAPIVEESPVGDDSIASSGISEEEAAAWAAYGADEGSGSSGSDVSDDEAAMWAAYAADSSGNADESTEGSDVSEDEAAMWAAYAADSSTDDDGEDDYDEDADIEDSLGIGYY